MMRTLTGPVANAILRQIGVLVRIDPNDREKPILIIEDIESVDWASLTFVGQRHIFTLRLEGPAAAISAAQAQLGAALASSEIALAGGFVAEICADAGDCRALPDGRTAWQFRVEALSIRD